jgi:hypothetical protein
MSTEPLDHRALQGRADSPNPVPRRRRRSVLAIRGARGGRFGQAARMLPQSRSFRCVRCGAPHDGPPRAYTVNEPAGWEVTAGRSSCRWGELFEEQAILHGPEGEEAWFIRGNIEIPVEDGTRLTYTVWLSVSQQNFERAHELWLDERRAQEPPFFAWLWSDLPGYPPTRQLKTMPTTVHPGSGRSSSSSQLIIRCRLSSAAASRPSG